MTQSLNAKYKKLYLIVGLPRISAQRRCRSNAARVPVRCLYRTHSRRDEIRRRGIGVANTVVIIVMVVVGVNLLILFKRLTSAVAIHLAKT